MVKAGSIVGGERRLMVRDLLLVVQIAICSVLVTSSIVAVRGMIRSMHSDVGFDPGGATLVETDVTMAGYFGDAVPPMQKRMIDAVASVPGVDAVGLIDQPPLWSGWDVTGVYKDEATELTPSNAATQSFRYRVSPDYFRAAGTTVLSGRTFTWRDDENVPRVAVVNQEFARRMFGSIERAMGASFKLRDGVRIQIAGVVENGKYATFAETQKAALFLPILQSPSNGMWLVVRSARDPQPLAATIRTTLRGVDASLPLSIETWRNELNNG